MSNVEFNIHRLKEQPDYELSFFDVKEASEKIEKARDALDVSIKAMRIFRKGEEALKIKLRWDYEQFRKTVNQGRVLSNSYIRQCKVQNTK